MKAQVPPVEDVSAAAAQPRPLPNTYWVHPDRLLAGEYPGAFDDAETTARLKRLLAAGIDSFIDLTEEDELPGYTANLAALDPAIPYQRFSIIDHGLPEPSTLVGEVIAALEQQLASGRRIYLHCRAGVGRTGTVLGCYLISRGLQSEVALDHLAGLWRQSARSRAIPQIPETAAQARYVRLWRAASAGGVGEGSDARNRIAGAFLGLAVGEAAAGASPGQWASETAMTLLLAESLLACSGNNLTDQMQRYLRWQQAGHPAGGRTAVAVPAEVKRAIATWQWTRKPYAGSHDPTSLDPHALARTTAIALYFRNQPATAIEAAAEAARTTNQAPIVLDCCRLFTVLLLEALAGASKEEILSPASGYPAEVLRSRVLKPEVQLLLGKSWNIHVPPAREATVNGVLSVALWAFACTANFGQGLTLALRSAAPASAAAAAAVFGALAGAHYSAAHLPAEMRCALADRELLEDCVTRLGGAEAAQP